MSHDPLCPAGGMDTSRLKCWRCALIAKVRADEREQAAQRVESLECRDVCGCSITIPNAAAAASGES